MTRLERFDGDRIIDSKKDLFAMRATNDFATLMASLTCLALLALANAFDFMYNHSEFLV